MIFSNKDKNNENTPNAPTIQHSTFLSPNTADVEKFLKFNENNFTVLSLNLDSLHSKKDFLRHFINEFLSKNLFFSAICVQEARIIDVKKISMLDVPDYALIPMARIASTKGGLVTFLHDSFSYTETPELYKKSRLYEAQYIDVIGPSIKSKVTVVNLYRPPRPSTPTEQSVKDFLNEIEPSFAKLKSENANSANSLQQVVLHTNRQHSC